MENLKQDIMIGGILNTTEKYANNIKTKGKLFIGTKRHK